jgi:hypothetical protein
VTPPVRRRRLAASAPALLCLALLSSAALTSCGGGTHSPTTTAVGVPSLVPGPPSRYGRVTVSAGARQVDVPTSQLTLLAPLLIARNLGVPASLADFGLDRPLGQLVYETSGAVAATVTIGAANFDRHGFYATLAGDATVYLVLADAIRPVLALVGVQVAPPSS